MAASDLTKALGFLNGAAWRRAALAVAVFLAAPTAEPAEPQTGPSSERQLTLAAVTALQDTGFLQHILPAFTQRTGIAVTVQSQPAGAALRLAREGKVDALLLDDYDREVQALDDGVCVDRQDVMYSDLVLAGPRGDPAGISGMASIIDAAKLIAASQSPFVARGDDSSVASTERSMWEEAEIPVGSDPALTWYIVTKADMARSLAIAVARNAYVLTDRASWLRLGHRGRLQILVQDDPRLAIQFGVMSVNPARHPKTRTAAAKALADWLTSKEGQSAIAQFQLQKEAPYVPNHGERGN